MAWSWVPYGLKRLIWLWAVAVKETVRAIAGVRSCGYPKFISPKGGRATTRIEDENWVSLKKLHLGAGQTYLKGYVNADIPDGSLAEASDSRIDARCYIHDLSIFTDNSFDVVELYHVIEHATTAEALRGVKEIFRVLNDLGGEVVIECPDLAKCALNYLREPAVLKVGLDGFYGDSTWDHVGSMAHKHGYDPGTLRALLVSVGFHADLIFEIPARRYRQRDVRIVAFKGQIDPAEAMARARERARVDTVTRYGPARR